MKFQNFVNLDVQNFQPSRIITYESYLMSHDVSVKTGASWFNTQKSWRKIDQLGIDFRMRRGLIFHFRLRKRKSEMNFLGFHDPVLTGPIRKRFDSAYQIFWKLDFVNWVFVSENTANKIVYIIKTLKTSKNVILTKSKNRFVARVPLIKDTRRKHEATSFCVPVYFSQDVLEHL